MTSPKLPTVRLLSGQRLEPYTPQTIAEAQQHDPDGDRQERQEREDRMREKGE